MKNVIKILTIFFVVVLLFCVFSNIVFSADSLNSPALRGGGGLEGEIGLFYQGNSFGAAITFSDPTCFIIKQIGDHIDFGIGDDLLSFDVWSTLSFNSNLSYNYTIVLDSTSEVVGSGSISSLTASVFSVYNYNNYSVFITSTVNVSTYSISFNSNGGSSITSLTGRSTIPNDIHTNTAYQPTRQGYSFDGWYRDSSLTNRAVGGSSISSNTTLYAKWISASYTISFNSNGGSSITSLTGRSTIPDDVQTNSVYQPTRQGYSFRGWYIDSSFTNLAVGGSSISSNITLYAKWRSQSYTISFNSNGGSSITSLTGRTTIPSDIDVNSAYQPTRQGYTFGGWYMDSSFTNRAVGGSSISSDTTLYAKWVSSSPQYYNITYHDDLYTWTDDSGFVSLDSASLSSSLASYHDSTQYAFDGWYYDSGFTQIASVGDVLSTDIHLYAKLVPVSTQFVTLSIYYNGTMQATRVMALPFYISVQYSNNQLYFGHADCNYSFNYSADTQYYVEVIEAGTNIVYVNRFEVTNPTNYNYNVLSGDNVRINITTIDHTISPVDEIFEITFDSGRGNFVAPINSVNGELPSLPHSVRYGFRFDGWYYDSSYTLPAHVGDSISADTVLYAKWTFVGDPEELTADPGNVLRGMFTGLTESGLTVFLTVGNHIGFGGITIMTVLITAGVILIGYYVIKIVGR